MTSEGNDSGQGAWKRASAGGPVKNRWLRPAIMVAVVVALGFIGWFFTTAFSGLDRTSGDVEAFASAAVAKVAKGWDAGELATVATPALVSSLQSGTSLAERYRILGNLTSVGKCTTYRLNITNGVGDAEVRCAAQFASASTSVVLGLSQTRGEWKIYSLSVML